MVLRRQQEVRSRAGSSAGTAAGFFLYTSRTAYSRTRRNDVDLHTTLQ